MPEESLETSCDVDTIEIVEETNTTVDMKIDNNYIGVVEKPEPPTVSIVHK